MRCLPPGALVLAANPVARVPVTGPAMGELAAPR